MATYDLEEQEQLAEIKAWWKQYGNLLMNVLTAAAIVVIAWQAWNWYQRSQATQAAMVFNVLQQAAHAKDVARVKAASGELLEKYSGTTYAALGALTSAKAMLDAGDAKSAKAQLQWLAEKGKDEIRDIARLRLAAVLLDEKAYDAAIKALDGNITASFEARFADTRGDILAAQEKRAEAKDAYRAAIAKLEKSADASSNWQNQSNVIYREVVQQKLDALGGA